MTTIAKPFKGLLPLILLAFSITAQALEVEPDAVEMVPAGTTIGLMYLQHAQSNTLYIDGKKQAGSHRLTTDFSLFRVVHSFGLAEGINWDAQAVLPVGRVKASGDSSALGEASGAGFVMIGGPIKFRVNGNDILLVGPYLFLPTGSYDHNRPLNIGENRWSTMFQLGYVKRLAPGWSANFIADAHFYGRNTDFGPARATLSQKPRYELQTALRYGVAPGTELALGAGWVTGGRTELDGVSQSDRLNTVYGRVTATHFLSRDMSVQLAVGRDLKVESGYKEAWRVNMRLALAF